MRIDAATAQAQAAELLNWMGERAISPVLRNVIFNTLANPEAGSDTLLILTDALRITAEAFSGSTIRDGIGALADRLAELAPTRS